VANLSKILHTNFCKNWLTFAEVKHKSILVCFLPHSVVTDTTRYDTIAEFNVDSKAEYLALSSTRIRYSADCDRQAYPNETGPVSVFYPDGDPCILHKQRRKFVHFAAFLFNK